MEDGSFSHLKIGIPERKRSYSNHPCSGAMLVWGGVHETNMFAPENHWKMHFLLGPGLFSGRKW